VGADDFEQALEHLVLEIPLALSTPQQGWLVRTSSSSPHDADKQVQRWLRKSFGGMCRPGQPKEDCLSLLDDVMGLSSTDKLAIALGLSFEPMRESIADAVEDTLAPQLFYAVALTGVVTWVVLAANPEPVFTKSLAVVSALMLIYLGVDGFLEMVKASLELKRSTDRANTYEELEQASQRFCHTMGPQVARVVILAVTVVVSRGMVGGASGMASRLPLLPHFSEATAVGATQVGVRLEAVTGVSAVAVVEGNLIISLAPTAVAMAATGPGGGDRGPGEWVEVDEYMSESARSYQAQVTGAPRGSAYRVKAHGEEVDFDGYQDGALLEAKGPNYAQFVRDDLEFEDYFKGLAGILKQARRQIEAAPAGTPIRWLVAEKKFADALGKLFLERRLSIQVVHVPPAP
jgi:hypothetical protein